MRRLSATWWLASLGWLASCSSDPSPPADGETQGGGFLVGDDAVGPNGQSGAGGDGSLGPQCLGETRQAEAIALDIFVMLDISGSMLEALPQVSLFETPPTKWDAVRESLEAFVQAPETAEIGIGLQYFPQSRPDVPSFCTSNAECGAGGPCTSSLCVAQYVADDPADPAPPVRFLGAASEVPCSSDDDCAFDEESCQPMLGVCIDPDTGVPPLPLLARCNVQNECAGLPGTVCELIGACEVPVQNQREPCTATIACPAGAGACVDFPHRCENQTSCEIGEYATPAVPISTSPARGLDIVTSLRAQAPEGLTPTGPALTGALDHARLWAEQNPGRQVVTVLATDGLPTECAPVDIPEIAQIASQANTGARPVRTFVIGVFSAADLGADGQERLDDLARSGGTERAFVINAGANAGNEFLDALNLIRDTAVSCEFELDASAELDFERVNLRVGDASGNTTALFNVGDASACGNDPGWYYLRNAAGAPTQIKVCPSTCAGFMTDGVQAELEIGCATRIR